MEPALKLLNLGFAVIPVNDKKQPIAKWKEFQQRLPTKEEVVQFWETYPNANIGIVTGLVSHLLVVDIDPRNGGTDEKFREIPTVVAQTAGGGKHFYFRIEEKIFSKPNFYQGIDIKADGGFVVAPPSLIDYGEYVWLRTPFTVPPLAIPEWLLSEMTEATFEDAQSVFAADILDGVDSGNRNAAAAIFAGHLLARYPIDEWDSHCWPQFKLWNTQNRPPLSESELKKTFESIRRNELPKKQARQNSFPPSRGLGTSVAERNVPIYEWNDFINAPKEEGGTWLVKNLIKPGWLVVVGGHGKQGKTTLVMHLLNAVRQGKPFVFESTSIPVIFLNCEMHEDDLRELIKDVSGNSPVGESALIQSPIKPLDTKVLHQLLSSQPKSGICVIDSFRGAFLLENDYENQAGRVGVILRDLQNIARETNWTIIVIHHFNKEGTGDPRDLSGSGEWLSAPDAIITWVCPKLKYPGTLSITGRIPPIENQSIRLGRETIEFLGTVEESGRKEKEEQIMAILKEEGGTTSEKMADKTGLPPGTVRRILSDLVTSNKLREIGQGVKNDPKIYLLPEDIE